MPATHDSFVNFGSTTLAGGAGGAGTALNPSDTSMTVNDTSKVPSSAPFPLLLTSGASNEIVKCTNVAGGVYTIVRAQEGTAALTFAVGSTVANEFTAGSAANLYTRVQKWPYNIRDYGAVGDGVMDANAAITATATALTTTSSPGPFTAAMTGRSVLVRGAGASGGDLWATATYVSATQLTLSVAATTTVSGALVFVVNTDDYPALTAMMADIVAAGGGDGLIPAGVYYINSLNSGSGATVTSGAVRIRGQGSNATWLVPNGATATAGSCVLSANAGTSLTVEDLTMIAPPNTAGFYCRGIWHQGTSGRLEARRVAAWNFSSGIEMDGATAAGLLTMYVEDCDASASPLLNLGGAGIVVGDFVTLTVRGGSVHDFGVAASNQNHGMYIHQSVDTDVRGVRFGTNRGTGWAVKMFNGTGNSPNASVEDCAFESGSYQGILTNPTVRTRVNNCRFFTPQPGVSFQFDCDVTACEFDGMVGNFNYIAQTSATAACDMTVKDCWFNLSSPTLCFPIKGNIAGTNMRFRNCIFLSNQAHTIFNPGGSNYYFVECEYADSGPGQVSVMTSTTPAIGTPATNVGTLSVVGNDARGYAQFTVTTATVPAGTALFTVTFAHTYAAAPIVIVTNQTGALGAIGFAVSAVGASSFVVRNNDALPVAASYQVAYLVMG